jgi:hypothetical protein
MVALRVKIAAQFKRTKAITAIFQTITRKMTGTYEASQLCVVPVAKS